jgi:hypothetical protein
VKSELTAAVEWSPQVGKSSPTLQPVQRCVVVGLRQVWQSITVQPAKSGHLSVAVRPPEARQGIARWQSDKGSVGIVFADPPPVFRDSTLLAMKRGLITSPQRIVSVIAGHAKMYGIAMQP